MCPVPTRRSFAELAATLQEFGADALPQRLDHGDSAELVVLCDIVDCDALDGSDPTPSRVQVRTLVGTSRLESLPEIAAPS